MTFRGRVLDGALLAAAVGVALCGVIAEFALDGWDRRVTVLSSLVCGVLVAIAKG